MKRGKTGTPTRMVRNLDIIQWPGLYCFTGIHPSVHHLIMHTPIGGNMPTASINGISLSSKIINYNSIF